LARSDNGVFHLELQFFNDLYDDELTEDDVRGVLGPLFLRHRMTLRTVMPHQSYMSGPPWLWVAEIDFSQRARPLASILSAAKEISALLEAFHTKVLDRSSARDLVLAGRAELLVGQRESQWLDAKKLSYPISSSEGKIQIAEAVARFANSEDGGLIVIGIETRKDSSGSEILRRVRPIAKQRGSRDRHRQALEQHLYPLPDYLRIDVVDYGAGEVILIDIPGQREELKPFLVQGSIVNGKYQGAYISWVRRRDDASFPITASMIHATLVAGRSALRNLTLASARENGGDR
jgi:hypothetical protein